MAGVGELSRATGVPARTLEVWSDLGLLRPARTTRRSHRRFGEDDFVRAAFVRALREEGVDLRRASRALSRFERRLWGDR